MLIVYILGPLVVIGVFLFLKKFYLTDARRMTSRTVGTVVRAEERVIVSPTERRVETELVVSYAAGGRDWSVTGHVHGPRAKYYPPGRELPIKYNPANPNMAELIQ